MKFNNSIFLLALASVATAAPTSEDAAIEKRDQGHKVTPPSPINASPGCVLRSLEPKYNAPIQFQAWATCEKVGKSGRLLNLAYDKDGPSDEAEARKQGKSSKWCYVSSAGSQNVVETCADSANGTLPLNLNAGDYTCLGTSRDILGLARTQVQRDHGGCSTDGNPTEQWPAAWARKNEDGDMEYSKDPFE